MGWQDTRMRKPGTLGVVGTSHACSQGFPTPGGRGQRGEEKLQGRLLFPPNNLGTIKLQASPYLVSHLCLDSCYFVCQASIRYQTQRTKINPEEQRKPVEVAICLPLHESTQANLRAGHRAHSFPLERGWCCRMRCTAFEKSNSNHFLVRTILIFV